MAKYSFDKLFSREEANELVPRLDLLMRQVQSQAKLLRGRVAELADHDDAIERIAFEDVIARCPELKGVTARMAELADQIESLGCLLKDVDLGLVDFPSELEGRLVFLCWQSGEPQVVAWHGLESGFSSRQLIPGVSKPYLN